MLFSKMYFLLYAWAFDDVMKLTYLKFYNSISSRTKKAFDVQVSQMFSFTFEIKLAKM